MKGILPLLFCCLILGCSKPAPPCDCPAPTPEQALAGADIVFEGICRYAQTNWVSGGMKYSFEVKQTWKRGLDRYAVVNTPFENQCGVVFEEGQTYLVYVRKKFSPRTDRCLGARAILMAGEDLTFLGPGMAPRPSPLIGTMMWAITIPVILAMVFLVLVVLRKRILPPKS
ncbi:MAG: hypothetical protein SF053_15960 [Bacteroidia bacterium]|nr:hypothetical protein [Bacteroidia bacterium]